MLLVIGLVRVGLRIGQERLGSVMNMEKVVYSDESDSRLSQGYIRRQMHVTAPIGMSIGPLVTGPPR